VHASISDQQSLVGNERTFLRTLLETLGKGMGLSDSPTSMRAR
jgi:hypothetical protein